MHKPLDELNVYKIFMAYSFHRHFYLTLKITNNKTNKICTLRVYPKQPIDNI